MASQAEEAAALNAISDQLAKALNELVTAIQNAGNTTPEVDAATAKLQQLAQDLDNIVPDQP